jgi:hypothetical protein
MLDEGQYSSITEMAEAERLDRGYMGRLLQLTLLAPEIVEVVLDGRQSKQIKLPALMRPLSVDWDQQRLALDQGVRRPPHGLWTTSASRRYV